MVLLSGSLFLRKILDGTIADETSRQMRTLDKVRERVQQSYFRALDFAAYARRATASCVLK